MELSAFDSERRVISGMRPTGRLHLGHQHGVLNNWVKLQHEYECLFFVADWHALSTHYEQSHEIEQHTWDMVIDWLAVGIKPTSATLFIQSKVPEHAELHLILSMITPLGWLQRVPAYKDQQERLKDIDLSTYGFLGYPLLQAADILAYRAGWVPVGADQVTHIELAREVARRFNHLYGRDPGFEEQAEAAIGKLSRKPAQLYRTLQKRYQEQGDHEALETARALVQEQGNISLGDRERLYGYLEGGGKVILPEPRTLLSQRSMLPGLDGQKMSKSYENAIALREAPDVVEHRIRTMPTDPARGRRSDPGEPEHCPVWPLHQTYSDESACAWVQEGCRSAAIGCLDCKRPLIDAINEELGPIRERAEQYEQDPRLVKSILKEGTERARGLAKATLDEVRAAVGLDYR